MDIVTLTHEQYLNFTGWSENHALKQTVQNRIDKLKKMGMQEITYLGRGKKTIYTFTIPSGFWRMLLIPTMSYTIVGADYINHLIEGKDIINKKKGILVRFSSEIIQELAEIHGVGAATVKTICGRIRKHLKACSYIRLDMPESIKSHRVKRTRGDDWITGDDAFQYDQQARIRWTSFFRSKLAQYQQIEPTATKIPMYIFGAEAKRIYQADMARWLGVEYYRVAKPAYVTDNMTNDINYARQTFLVTHNLSQVKEELSSRQKQYQIEKQSRDEQNELKKRQDEALTPSKEERKEIQKRLDTIGKSSEVTTKMRTPQEQEELNKLMRDFDVFLSNEIQEHENNEDNE
ncbi:hypothetical protein AR454_07745 [Bacillus mycoides]|uniref:hypothetical protein n=1 Tax=Bacillus mycoides TaxID=1405 RepID=UPI001E4B3D7B|nr:hypothetical protein [Bacillus mycoides]MCD4646905.1 hypothetical protein [Bacillus mycoides]